ncbi:MAG: hypothetical protein JXQ99_14715 [Hyphomicrobiaceae bacterium]
MTQTVTQNSKSMLAVVVISAMTGISPLQAQEGSQTSKNVPELSPDMKKSLDAVANHLKGQWNSYKKKIQANERRLFATPESIMRLCQSPMRPKRYRAVADHFKATEGDPVSLPTIDCMFLKTETGGGLLWTYKPAHDNSYYMLRAHEGLTPKGAFVFARHPFNFNHRIVLNGPDWKTTRSKFKPLDAFPLKENANLILTEQTDGGQPATVPVKVIKTFPIMHTVNGQPANVENLHIVVKHPPQRKLLGKLQDVRQWYIYAEKANVVVQRSQQLILQDSINKAHTGVSKDISQVSYIKDGKYILELSARDLAPLRDWLENFDVWR